MWRGGVSGIKRNVLTVPYCTVLFRTVQYCSVLYSTVPYPYCTEVPFFDFFDSRLQNCLSISRARLP